MILKSLTRYPKKLRMKNKIILEVGKNHLGNTNLLFKYLKNFNLNEVYGFTLQLRENKFYTGNNKILKFNNSTMLKFKKICKMNNKKFGLSIQNSENLESVDFLQPDFIKVLSYSTKNFDFCSNLRNKYNFPIYYSLGLIKKNKSISFINDFYKHVSKKHTKIIYTKIDKLLYDFSIKEILLLSSKLKNNLAYGHHFDSNFFPLLMKIIKINTFFLYIKHDKNMNYPDNINAYNIKSLREFLKHLALIDKVN